MARNLLRDVQEQTSMTCRYERHSHYGRWKLMSEPRIRNNRFRNHTLRVGGRPPFKAELRNEGFNFYFLTKPSFARKIIHTTQTVDLHLLFDIVGCSKFLSFKFFNSNVQLN